MVLFEENFIIILIGNIYYGYGKLHVTINNIFFATIRTCRENWVSPVTYEHWSKFQENTLVYDKKKIKIKIEREN